MNRIEYSHKSDDQRNGNCLHLSMNSVKEDLKMNDEWQIAIENYCEG